MNEFRRVAIIALVVTEGALFAQTMDSDSTRTIARPGELSTSTLLRTPQRESFTSITEQRIRTIMFDDRETTREDDPGCVP